MTPRVLLYTMPISHWCVSADRMLAFKGVRFRSVYTPYHDKTQLIRATGQDYVPSLVWGGQFVPWHKIPDFLERKVASPALFPKGQKGAAKLIEHWGHAVLEEQVWQAIVTEVPPVLRSEVERWVFEEMQTRKRGPWAQLKARKKEFEENMAEHLAMVDGALSGKKWLLGVPSAADFGVYGGLSPLLTLGGKIPPKMRNLRAWAGRIQAL